MRSPTNTEISADLVAQKIPCRNPRCRDGWARRLVRGEAEQDLCGVCGGTGIVQPPNFTEAEVEASIRRLTDGECTDA